MRKPLINPGIIKRLKSFFAIIQDTDTATRYIPAGKYVLYKNIACHASQNIESGDTLALGTNLVTDSDGFVNCLNDGLKTKVNTSDIVNALTSTDSTKPLSAAQGKVLNDGLTTLNSKLCYNAGNKTDAGLDAMTTEGIYFVLVEGSSTSPGKRQWCFLIVKSPSSGYCAQTMISTETSCEIASRYMNNGTWSNWFSSTNNTVRRFARNGAADANDTYQLPYFSESKAYTILLRRYGYAASVTLTQQMIIEGSAQNVTLLFTSGSASDNKSVFSVSASGLITINTTTSPVFIEGIAYK